MKENANTVTDNANIVTGTVVEENLVVSEDDNQTSNESDSEYIIIY